MTALKPVNRENEMRALIQAISVERRARYIDFRGKRSTFSEFMRRTSEKLCRRFPNDSRWSTIRGLFRQYPNLDLPSRIAVLRRTEEILAAPEVAAVPVPGAPSGASRSSTKPGASGKKSGSAGKQPGSKQPGSAGKQPGSAGFQPAPDGGSARKSRQDGGAPRTPAAANSNPNKNPNDGIPSCEAPSSSNHERRQEPVVAGRQASAARSFSQAQKTDDPSAVEVKFVKGVGPKMAELLARLEIHTVEDLLRHYPRQHLDFQHRRQIRALQPGEDVTIFGTIKSVGAFQSKRSNVSVVSVLINDGTGSITISKFIGGKGNRYLLDRYKDSFPKGAQVMASGKVERDNYSGRLQLKNAEVELLGFLGDGEEAGESIHAGRIVPVYPLTEGVSLRYLRQIIHNALTAYGDSIKDCLPQAIRERFDLVSLPEALQAMHFPDDFDSKERGRTRLVFDELFSAQLELAMRRYRFKKNTEALSLSVTDSKMLAEFRAALPFKLTGAQERVFKEIAGDLAAEAPMHRLVQGDVGSGKTVVAAMASLVAIENGYQVAVMAPTEILAEQHYRQFQRWLTPLGLRCALLLGKQGVKERRVIQQDLASGQVHVAIGTHALIQDDVEFAKLGFVIIDEQHRFGVKQRARLKSKGVNPELLTMTATPIPRTLALSLHGDLDVSEIDELPPGRKPIATKMVTPGEKAKLHKFILEQIAFGRQAYIVFPLIEESESLSAKAATAEFEKLTQTAFREKRVGLMHGKLKPQEKDEVMDRFRNRDFDILISTTVIEVGVDVPNATVMVIEDADRFGLAQLHQLRGRVGRGGDQSYCFLVADAKSPTVQQRLGIMTQTNDGFVIAEKDLEIRGPGEFMGVRQSGMPDLVLSDIVKDAKILEQARAAATDLVKDDPELQRHPKLAEQIAARQKSVELDLISSG